MTSRFIDFATKCNTSAHRGLFPPPAPIERYQKKHRLFAQRKPRADSSKFLLCTPWTIGRSGKILYRSPHIITRLLQLCAGLGISIAFLENKRANAVPVQSLLERRAK